MTKKIIHLIPAALLLFSCACKPSGIFSEKENFLKKNQGIFSAEEKDFSASEEKLPTPVLPLSQITEEGYWDTEPVDIQDVDPARKLIALTFDDAPARTLERILAVFAAFNEENPDCKATATLFINGERLDAQNLHLLHAACALGFELGNHTQSHTDLSTLSKEALLQEFSQTDGLLEKIDGKKLHLVRAPFGRTNELVKQTAPTPLIDWTIDTLDWTGASTEEIFSRVWEGRFSGAISLMHDGYEGTVCALKRLLPALKKDGYQVVTVSKMIKAHGCRFQKGKTYIRARKQ